MKSIVYKTIVFVNWKVTVLLALFTLHCSLFTFSQTTFTERLQQSNAGEGKVTVTQDQSIERLVNTPSVANTTPRTTQPQNSNQRQDTAGNATNKQTKDNIANLLEQTATPDTTSLDGRKKVIKGGYKVSGYRVQIFAGGNSRNDRVKAEKTGEEIKHLFPTEPVYVHFYSPRWICRMGNYRSYEEAHEVLRSVKKLGYASAIIVKGKITVPYQ